MKRGSATLDPAPPRADGHGWGGGWAWVMTARGIIEAELVRGLIEAAGVVPVALDSSDPTPGSWLFLSGNVNALVRVYVPASLLGEARLALLESGFEVPDERSRPKRSPAEQPASSSPAGQARRVRRAVLVVGAALVAVVIALMLAATLAGRSTCVTGIVC